MDCLNKGLRVQDSAVLGGISEAHPPPVCRGHPKSMSNNNVLLLWNIQQSNLHTDHKSITTQTGIVKKAQIDYYLKLMILGNIKLTAAPLYD